MAVKPKIVQAKRSILISPISETETGSIRLDKFVDIYGNNLDPQSDFFGTVYLTINPGGSNEEIISFTNGTLNSDGTYTINTGIVRHLAAKTPYSTSGTAQAHSGGEDVVVSNEPQFYKSILDYIDGLTLAAAVPASKTANGYVKLTESNNVSRARAALVSQQGTPGLTVAILPFSISVLDKSITYAGGNSPSMSAPATNPRYDLVVYDSVNTVIAVRTGTEAGSPTVPTPTSGDIPLCSIYHRTTTTKIMDEDDSTNSYIASWYQPSMYKTGIVTSDSYPIVTEVDQSQTTSNSTVAVGEANATTKHSLIAQSFIPTVSSIRGVKFWKIADTGSFTGTVKISLQASSSGLPSGTDLASFTISNAAWLKQTAAAEIVAQFSTQYESMTIGAIYWIVYTISTGDNSNHPNLGANSAGGYANGLLKYNNTTDGWVSLTSILYFKTLEGTLSKIVKTESTSGLHPAAVRAYSVVDLNKTTVSSANTNEVVVYSKLLEGGFFSANSGIKITMSYNARPVGSDVTMKVKLNGTEVSSGMKVSQQNSTNIVAGNGILDFILLNQGSVSSQFNVWRSIWLNNAVAAATTLGISSDSSNGTSAVDTSQPILLEVTFQISTTTNTSWAHNWTLLEKIG